MIGSVSMLIDEIEEEMNDFDLLGVHTEARCYRYDYDVYEQELFIKCKWIKRLERLKQFQLDSRTCERVESLLEHLKDSQVHLIEKYNANYDSDDNSKRERLFDILELPKSTFDNNYIFTEAIKDYTEHPDCLDYIDTLYSFIDLTYGTSYMETGMHDELDELFDSCDVWDEPKIDHIYKIACEMYPLVKTKEYLRPLVATVDMLALFGYAGGELKELFPEEKLSFVADKLITMFPRCKRFIRVLLKLEEEPGFDFRCVPLSEAMKPDNEFKELFERLVSYDGCYVLSWVVKERLEESLYNETH